MKNGGEECEGRYVDYISGTLACTDYEPQRIATEGLA